MTHRDPSPCPVCGESWRRSREDALHRERYCGICREAVAVKRWSPEARVAQARAAQVEAGEWAREVLGDPRTLILAVDRGNWHIPRVRGETVGGETVFAASVRAFDDPGAVRYGTALTPAEIESWARAFDGTLGPAGFRPHADRIAASRPIMWHAHGISGMFPLPAMRHDRADTLSERFALWNGSLPYRTAPTDGEPFHPWHHPVVRRPSRTPVPEADDLATEVDVLRSLLYLIAYSQPPEPRATFWTTRSADDRTMNGSSSGSPNRPSG